MKINEKVTKTLIEPIEINYVPIGRLLLDEENPRYAGLAKGLSESQLLEKLKEEMHLDELIDSFEKNGFYNTEPLLVVKSTKRSDKYVVIEGNRRLAAIKSLLATKTKIDSDLKRQLQSRIPVAIYPNRKTLWSYLGFRHINGPQEWDSYSKAVYAFRVHMDYRIPIDKVAERIGDRHLTVVKMFNGLRVLNQAMSLGYFSADDMELRRFHFSHLYTILNYDSTRAFLGISGRRNEVLSKNPVPRNNIACLELLLEFLFGSKDEKKKPVIKSQNPDLKYLDTILGNKLAVKYLRENSQELSALENALAFTDTEDYRLEDYIFKAQNALRKASGYMNRYRGDSGIYRQMEEILQIVHEIMDRMDSKRKK